MANWEIDKTVEFCYGHRVWTQKLEEEFTDGDSSCKCRHLHGHQAKVQIFLKSKELNAQSMVTDFKHLGWAKKFFDNYVDHKFIVDRNDPLYDKIIGLFNLIPVKVPGTDFEAGFVLDLNGFEEKTPEYEYYEGFFIVDFCPTSENLSAWAQKFLQAKMNKINVEVSKVEWWETPKSRATYCIENDRS